MSAVRFVPALDHVRHGRQVCLGPGTGGAWPVVVTAVPGHVGAHVGRVVHDAPSLGTHLLSQGERLLDEGECSTQSRQELASILYGLRMDGLVPRGTP